MSDPAERILECCRLCGQGTLRLWFQLERSPRQISVLLTEDMVRDDAPVQLPVLKCDCCDFIQVPVLNQRISYDDYVLSWMQIQTLREYRECLAREFSASLGQSRLPVLDVGCGSGEFLQILSNLDQKVAGIEPSASLAERARLAGFEVIHDYVRPESIEGRRFGGFTCLQVLEHLDQPIQFLSTLRRGLSGDGLGLIEVPSLEKIIEDRRFYDFFGDHLNYFTARTLRMCCEAAGFDVICVKRTFAGQFLAATVRPAVSLCPMPAGEYFLRSMADLQQWAAEQVSLGKRMVFWGAGYKSIAAIAELNLDGIQCVVDSDRSKSGRVTPVSHLPITHPDQVDFSQVDAVLLVAMAYRDEIARQIRGPLQFTGVVVTCGDRLEFL